MTVLMQQVYTLDPFMLYKTEPRKAGIFFRCCGLNLVKTTLTSYMHLGPYKSEGALELTV